MFRRAGIAAVAIGALVVGGALAPVSPAAAAKKKKPTYKVSASASASSVKTSFPVTISGKVTPKSRATVKLQRYSAGTWVTIATKKLPKSSKYSFTTNVGKVATTLSYRVTKAKTKKIKAGVSKTVKVKAVTWGTVKAWGDNDYNQLGTGSSTPAESPNAVNVKGLTEVVSVASNPRGTTGYALRLDGTVWSWGNNGDGQLGTGSAASTTSTPARITALSNIKAIASAGYTGYALGKNGIVYAWGYNYYGELGNGMSGSGTSRSTPAAVAGLSSVTAIAAQEDGVLALRSDGSVYGWGYNTRGDIATGDFASPITSPRKIAGLPKITAIGAGADNGYAVGPYGTVYSWGYGDAGRLGDGTIGTNSSVPVAVAGLSGVTKLGSATGTAYAVGVSGTLWSWGRNDEGALGIGKTYDQLGSSTVAVRTSLVGVRSVSGGDRHGLALLNNGTVRSWGYNGDGELGDGTLVAKTSPVTVKNLTRVTSIAGGEGGGYAVIG